jgi:hypothetical protein
MTVDQEPNTKDIIEIDRWLWRKFESLALYLANKRGYHLTEKLPLSGRKWFDNDLICGLLYLSTAIWTLPHINDICERIDFQLLVSKI